MARRRKPRLRFLAVIELSTERNITPEQVKDYLPVAVRIGDGHQDSDDRLDLSAKVRAVEEIRR